MNLMKLSYWLAFFGAIIMIASNIILQLIFGFVFLLLAIGAEGLVGFELMPLTIAISLALGIMAVIYVKKSKKGGKKTLLILLIIGIIAAVGVFIPILPARIIDIGGGDTYPAPAVNLVNSLIYIEPYFLINYALIGRLSFVESDLASVYEDVEVDDYSITAK